VVDIFCCGFLDGSVAVAGLFCATTASAAVTVAKAALADNSFRRDRVMALLPDSDPVVFTWVYLYIVKIRVHRTEMTVKRNLYSVKMTAYKDP
jgi:hypothetical protein